MTLRRWIGGALSLAVVAGVGLYAAKRYVDSDHSGVALLPPVGPPKVRPAPADWPAERSERLAAKDRYIAENRIAFDWFADFPFSQTDGTALILVRLLPLLAPEQWQGGDALLSEVGLFMDDRTGQTFLPRGVGFSGLDPAADDDALDMTSFTCGACHIGRVVGDDGQIVYIDGAVNTTFNIVKYYSETARTIQTLYAGETERNRQIDALTAAVLAALDKAEATSPTYFYEDYKTATRSFDAAYEARQIRLFRADARRHVQRFADYTEGFVGAFSDYLDKTYDGYQDEMSAGLPGMADASGVSASHGYQKISRTIGKTLGGVLLPAHPGLTDFMPVWEQDSRAVQWDPEQRKLVDGGGQYNGNIPLPMFRNLAAATTMGLDNPDIRVPAFAAMLLGRLPATPYPFSVDTSKAKRGEALFAANCAGCHQPNNGMVYSTLGTDPSRSQVINTALMLSGRRLYAGYCPPDLEINLAGMRTRPCAEYQGVSLKNFGTAIMRPLSDQQGYNATALHGVWATAPYLHNGSIPTMRHLLMPTTRPNAFVRGRLDYDEENLGFGWQDDGSGRALFDTTTFHALSNSGHDTNIVDGSTTQKLDWSDDPAGVDDLIEYLKTL